MQYKSVISMLRILWLHLPRARQKQFCLVLVLMVIASLTEVISIGAILPFLGVLTAPDQVYTYSFMKPIIDFFSITNPADLLLPVTILFIGAVSVAGAIRLLLLFVMTKLSYATGVDLSLDIYRRTLYQEYSIHISRNSSEVINGIISKTSGVITNVLMPVLTLVSSAALMIGVMSALFVIDINVALSAIFGFSFIYWIVIAFSRKKLKNNSRTISEQSTQIIKALQEGMGGIRDVLLDGSQQIYCEIYRNADLPLRRASGSNTFIKASPRFIVESIGMILISILAYSITLREDGIASAVPVLGALALGAQRLLPAFQQSYAAYATMKGTRASFEDVLDLLSQPLPIYANHPPPLQMPFNHELELRNLSFRYGEEEPWVLKDVNIKLHKGKRIGFMGATGSGKSTVLDIIMGLLKQSKGELLVDNQILNANNMRSWQANIAHVPQVIYLSDSTIEDNIAFGLRKNDIDKNLVREAAKKAQIADLIEGWDNGYNTLVGERGVRLSGGQRQRIGIARALYKKANILIFDEATSALDYETEDAVMNAIEGLGSDLTILIIAHRLSTLKFCDQIIKLDKNNSIQTGSYQELINEKN